MNRSSCSTFMPTALMVRVRRMVLPSGSGFSGPASVAGPVASGVAWGWPGRGSGRGCGPRFFGSPFAQIHWFICSMRSTARYWSNVHARGVSNVCQTSEPAGRFAASAAVSDGSRSYTPSPYSLLMSAANWSGQRSRRSTSVMSLGKPYPSPRTARSGRCPWFRRRCARQPLAIHS